MKNPVIASPSFNYAVITTVVYALLYPIFFEMDNAYGGVNFVDNDKTIIYSQQQLETDSNSPCFSSAKICIAMCA